MKVAKEGKAMSTKEGNIPQREEMKRERESTVSIDER